MIASACRECQPRSLGLLRHVTSSKPRHAAHAPGIRLGRNHSAKMIRLDLIYVSMLPIFVGTTICIIQTAPSPLVNRICQSHLNQVCMLFANRLLSRLTPIPRRRRCRWAVCQVHRAHVSHPSIVPGGLLKRPSATPPNCLPTPQYLLQRRQGPVPRVRMIGYLDRLARGGQASPASQILIQRERDHLGVPADIAQPVPPLRQPPVQH
jgi:hypothetical protein